MEYFDDIQFRFIVHRYFVQGDVSEFRPGANSIELIRSGHIFLFHNGEKILLDAPALFWMRAGDLYRFAPVPGQKTPCEHLYCDCSGPRAEKMVSFLEKRCPEGFLIPSDPEKVSEIFFDMVKAYRLGKEQHHAELAVNLDLLMLEAVRTLEKPARPGEDPYGILLLGDEIRKNPFADFPFAKIAAKKGISLHHFRRLFRQSHQRSPCEFLREQKMIRAAELLRLTDMRIKEIMFNCSFSSEMEFSRSFRKFSSCSPRMYRKLYANREKVPPAETLKTGKDET